MGAEAERPETAAIRKRARWLGRGCAWRGDEHQVCAERWRIVALAVNVPAGVFSAVAGAALLASAKEGSALAIAGGVIGLLGAALTTASGHLGAEARAEAHRRAAAGFSGLATAYYDIAYLPEAAPQHLRELLDELNARRAELLDRSPLPELWAKRRVASDRSNTGKHRRLLPIEPGDHDGFPLADDVASPGVASHRRKEE